MKNGCRFSIYSLLTLLFLIFQTILLSQNFTNLLVNPSFEDGLNQWVGSVGEIESNINLVNSGSKSLKICSLGSISQKVAASEGKTYLLDYTTKTAGTNENIQLSMKFLSTNNQLLAVEYSIYDSPLNFSTNTFKKIAPQGTAWLEVSINKINTGCIYIDDISLKEEQVYNYGSNTCSKSVGYGLLLFTEQLSDGNFQTFSQRTANPSLITTSIYDKNGNFISSSQKHYTEDLAYYVQDNTIKVVDATATYPIPTSITNAYIVDKVDLKKADGPGWVLLVKPISGTGSFKILEVDTNFNILKVTNIASWDYYDFHVSIDGYMLLYNRFFNLGDGFNIIVFINRTTGVLSELYNNNNAVEFKRLKFKDNYYAIEANAYWSNSGAGITNTYQSYGSIIFTVSDSVRLKQSIYRLNSTASGNFGTETGENKRITHVTGNDNLIYETNKSSYLAPNSTVYQSGIYTNITISTSNDLIPFKNADGNLVFWNGEPYDYHYIKYNCSVSPNPTTCTNNLLQNPGFESNLSNWQTTAAEIATTPVASGTKSLKMCTQGGSVTQTLAATAGKTYKLQYTAKTAGTNQNILFGLKFLSASWQPLATEYSSFDSPAGFTTNFIQKLAPTGAVWVEISMNKQNDGCVYIDDLCLTDGGVITTNPCSPDVTAPVIANCPANVTVTAAVGTINAIAQWTAPTASDICTTPTLTSTQASGTNFPIGSTTVTYTAKDAANNTATCSFTVNVSAQNTNGGCAGNLLQNPGFESNLTNWDGSGGQIATAPDVSAGSKSLKLCTTGDVARQTLLATAGKTYSLSWKIKTAGPNQNILIGLKYFSASYQVLADQYTSFDSPGSFSASTISKLAPVGTVRMEVAFYKQNGGCIYIDELCLIESGGGVNPCSPDITGPIIAGCPANISVTAAVGATLVVAQWTAPTATDNCPGSVTLTSNSNSGASFPIGSTTVTYTAKDVANITSFCSFSITVTAAQPGCNPCTYCAAKGDFPWEEWLAGVKIGTVSKTSSKSQYSDFTATNFALVKNTATNIELTGGFSYITAEMFYKVWIDYNHNGTFEEPSEVFIQKTVPAPANGTTANLTSVSATVPASALTGATRMRVSLKKGGYATPCETFARGEVEDFTVNIAQNLTAGLVREGDDEAEEILFFQKIGFLGDYTLFPNPASDVVYIKMSTPTSDGVTQSRPVTTVKLLNQLGKVDKVQEFSSINEEEIYEFSLQDISNGVYFMQIETAGKRAVVKKLVVSRMY
jgi:HYR domain/GEVED domain/Secretion system C-terminal sorting domain